MKEQIATIVEEVIKHLPTRHDQGRHAGEFGVGGGSEAVGRKFGEGKMTIGKTRVMTTKTLKSKGLSVSVVKDEMGKGGEIRYVVSLHSSNYYKLNRFERSRDQTVTVYVYKDRAEYIVFQPWTFRNYAKEYKTFKPFNKKVVEAFGIDFPDVPSIIEYAETK